MEKTIRVLIADDHPIIREGLRTMFAGQAQFEVVGEARSGAEVVELAERLRPDIVLMDMRMNDMDGVAATAEIKKHFPAIAVLILTTYDSQVEILRALKAGANGYLLKDTSRERLFAAVCDTVAGKSVLAPEAASALLQTLQQPEQEELSQREKEVLTLVAQGASNKEIARSLHISEATVKSHLIRIFRRLGVADRTAAAMRANERGLLKPNDS